MTHSSGFSVLQGSKALNLKILYLLFVIRSCYNKHLLQVVSIYVFIYEVFVFDDFRNFIILIIDFAFVMFIFIENFLQ